MDRHGRRHCIGATGVLFLFPLEFLERKWRAVCPFLFMVATGALQLGIGTMSLANGYARKPGSEAQSGSPWRRRWAMLVFPNGNEVYRDQDPGSFWRSAILRGGAGAALFLAPILLPLFDTVKK